MTLLGCSDVKYHLHLAYYNETPQASPQAVFSFQMSVSPEFHLHHQFHRKNFKDSWKALQTPISFHLTILKCHDIKCFTYIANGRPCSCYRHLTLNVHEHCRIYLFLSCTSVINGCCIKSWTRMNWDKKNENQATKLRMHVEIKVWSWTV